MQEITDLIHRHRECSRHIWNSYFYQQAEANDDWDLRDQFEDVCAKLFTSLVLWPIEKESYTFNPAYLQPQREIPFIRVIPTGSCGVFINREICSGYWDHPIKEVSEEDIDMRFIHYFDWSIMGIRDFEFFHVMIISSKLHPELNGRHALVKPLGLKVMYDGEVL